MLVLVLVLVSGGNGENEGEEREREVGGDIPGLKLDGIGRFEAAASQQRSSIGSGFVSIQIEERTSQWTVGRSSF